MSFNQELDDHGAWRRQFALRLKLMSEWARREIPKKISTIKEFLIEGTEPQKKYFSQLLVTSDGLQIFFWCGQIAPRSQGDPELTLPIAKLAKAGPKPEVWGQIEGVRPANQGTPQKAAEVIYKAYKNKRDVVYVLPVWGLIMMIIRNIPEFIFKKMKL